MAMATFVLVHGAWHGGWVWSRTARLLRDQGHEVFTPTLTGVGERAHLANREVNLSLHILDICNVMKWENLENVVLCGHSYGGAVVTGVADALAERVRSLVYIDAFVLRDGEALWDYAPPKHDYLLQGAGENGGRTQPVPSEEFKINEADLAWVKSKVVPMSIACFLERIRLQGKIDLISERTYVYCDGWSPTPFVQFYERFKDDPGWRVCTSGTGHHQMIDDPQGCAALLAKAG